MNKINIGATKSGRCLLIGTVSILACTFVSRSSLANGALPYCMGAKMCQMGGAGVAIPLDSTSGNINPALMANVGRDAAIDPLVVFQKERVDSSSTQLIKGTSLPPHTGSISNRRRAYAAGYSGFNYDLNPEWSIGFSTGGGGNNAKYNKSIISPALTAPTKLETTAGLLSQVFAYKPDCDQSYGLSVIVGYLQMKNNLTLFPSGAVTKGRGKLDQAFGAGARLGGQWNASEMLSLGAAVSTPIFFEKLRKYRDVIKHAPRLPAIATGGIAVHANKDTDLLLDLEGYFWKESPFTGKRVPVGQGWRNVMVVKFGVQHRVDDLTLRIGYNHGRTPIPNKAVLFNALSEVITISEHILSTGFTYNLNPGMSFDVGGAILFNKKIKDNGKGPAGLAAKGLSVESRGLLLSLGFNLKY